MYKCIHALRLLQMHFGKINFDVDFVLFQLSTEENNNSVTINNVTMSQGLKSKILDLWLKSLTCQQNLSIIYRCPILLHHHRLRQKQQPQLLQRHCLVSNHQEVPEPQCAIIQTKMIELLLNQEATHVRIYFSITYNIKNVLKLTSFIANVSFMYGGQVAFLVHLGVLTTILSPSLYNVHVWRQTCEIK